MDTASQHGMLETPLCTWLSARVDFTFDYFTDAAKQV
jgi:hypothetical protein